MRPVMSFKIKKISGNIEVYLLESSSSTFPPPLYRKNANFPLPLILIEVKFPNGEAKHVLLSP